jgi:hypothetical protein
VKWLRHGPAAYGAMLVAVTAFWAVFFGPAMALMYANVGYSGIAYPVLAFGLLALACVVIVAISRRLSPMSGWLATPILIAILAIALVFAVLLQPQTMMARLTR